MFGDKSMVDRAIVKMLNQKNIVRFRALGQTRIVWYYRVRWTGQRALTSGR